jgi:membrane associated rhomboid family serine protease
VAIGLFGWLLERRHGSWVVLALFLLGGVGGMAVTAAVYPVPIALGGNGAALALICAWMTADLLDMRAGREIEGDVLGATAIALVVALMPLAVREASWVAGGVGVLAGFAVGFPLARLQR